MPDNAADGRQDVCHRCRGDGFIEITASDVLEQAWWAPLFFAVLGVWKAYRADEGFAAGLIKHVEATMRPQRLHPWYLTAATVLEQERSRLEHEYRAEEARKQSQRAKPSR
jgi:hypothetical protein